MTRAIIENELLIDIPKLASSASRIHGREARTRAVEHMRIITARVRREWQAHRKRSARIHPEKKMVDGLTPKAELKKQMNDMNNHQVNFQ